MERSRLRMLVHRTVYVFSELPLAMLRFCVLLPLSVLGVGTIPLGFGIPILAVTLRLASGFAIVERRRLGAVLGRKVERPPYKVDKPIGSYQFADVLRTASDTMRWREWWHGVISLPFAMFSFFLAAMWWLFAVVGTASPLYMWMIPDRATGTFAEAIGFDNAFADVAVNTLFGLIFLATLPFAMHGLAAMHAGLARVLLTTERVADLTEQVTDLTASRDAAVSAEAGALRKLERDIHDGPQQRLVRLAMDLSTVQRRLETDPETAKPLIDEALTQTRETLDELRALSRGIAPPILADRGLPAALAALAARSPVPVSVDVALPSDVRLPEAIENAAYFFVAESLTNVAKHSAASRCTVTVSRTDRMVYVIVTDDGMGGAEVSKGHGIAGLIDRLRSLGGRLEVESPIGGPTIVSAELPC